MEDNVTCGSIILEGVLAMARTPCPLVTRFDMLVPCVRHSCTHEGSLVAKLASSVTAIHRDIDLYTLCQRRVDELARTDQTHSSDPLSVLAG